MDGMAPDGSAIQWESYTFFVEGENSPEIGWQTYFLGFSVAFLEYEICPFFNTAV